MSKKVYIAASFAYEDRNKTEERKRQIEEIVSLIQVKRSDWEFYLPHKLKIENAWDISLEEWSRAVYEHDVQALDEADVIIFISYGKENNAGSVWEVGYAIGQRSIGQCYDEGYDFEETLWHRKVICVKMTDEPESLMVSCSCDIILKKEEIQDYDWNNLPDYKTNLDKLS